MARARIIKPEFFRSRSLARVSIPALVTFEGLWAEADAKGRGVAHPLILKGSIWPLRDEITPDVIVDHMTELETTDHIVLYTVGEERYFEVTNWDRHQSAAYRTGESKHPAPPNRAVCTTSRAEIPAATPATPSGVGLPAETSNVVPFAQPVVQLAQPVVHKGKGREGKKTNSSRTCHPDFEAFWAKYPRREARADAERAFTKARTKVELDTILEAITVQRLAAKETRFVPYPASWLNGERWNDEAPASTTDQRNRDGSITLPDGTQMSRHVR